MGRAGKKLVGIVCILSPRPPERRNEPRFKKELPQESGGSDQILAGKTVMCKGGVHLS